jgi:hypothetical protein
LLDARATGRDAHPWADSRPNELRRSPMNLCLLLLQQLWLLLFGQSNDADNESKDRANSPRQIWRSSPLACLLQLI